VFQEWHEADESLVVVLRRAGYGRTHGKKLIGLIVAFALSVGIGITTSPAALASDTVTPATESSTPAEEPTATPTEESTSTDATSTDATSTDATSTDATSTDATSTDATSTDATSTVPVAPAISLVEIVGVARVGERLTASVSVSGTPPPSLSYVWQSASAFSGPYVDIEGATSDSYVLTSTDVTKYIRVNVTASNSEGTDGPTSSAYVGRVRDALFQISAVGEGVTIAVTSGNGQSAAVGTALTQDIVITVSSATATPVADESVTAVVVLGGGTLGVTTFTSDVNGTVTIPAGSWTMGGADIAFANSIDVYIGGSATKATVTATALYAANILPIGPTELGTFTVGSPTDFAGVTVVDQFGNPFSGNTGDVVAFTINGGGADGDVGPAGSPTDSITFTAPFSGGVVQGYGWTLGTTVGVKNLLATLFGSSTLTFTATGVADVAAQIAIAGGQSQTATVNEQLTNPLSITITDQFGNSVSGATVTASVSIDSVFDRTLSGLNLSNEQGFISWPFPRSTTAGVYTTEFFIENTSTSVVFTTTLVAGAAVDILLGVASDRGTASAGTSVGLVTVTVVDSFGNSVSGATVTAAADNGGGAEAAVPQKVAMRLLLQVPRAPASRRERARQPARPFPTQASK